MKSLPQITSIVAFPPLPSTSREGGFSEGRRTTRSAMKRDRECGASVSEASTAIISEEYDSDVTSVSRATTAKDSRRKKKKTNPPATPGKCAGLRAVKRQMEELELQDMEAQAERELEEERQSRRSNKERLAASNDHRDADRTPAELLFRRVEDDVKAIKRVAATSINLKGTYVKALKEASSSILEAAENMASQTSSREVRLLQKENDRLRN